MTVRGHAIAGLVLLAGCTRHARVAHPRDLHGKRVLFGDGIGQVAGTVVAGPLGDVTLATDRGPIPLDSFESVTEVSRLLGGLQGLGIGFLVGGIPGAALGYAGGDDECNENGHSLCLFTFTAGEKAVLSGVFFGLLGGAIGLLVGASRGHRTVYELDAAPAPRFVPTGPPGSAAGVTILF